MSPSTYPLRRFVCVTGVSGSGKSSLINETLHPILNQHFYHARKRPLPYKIGQRHRTYRQGDRDRPVAHRPHTAQQPRHLCRCLRRDTQPLHPAAQRPHQGATSPDDSPSTSAVAAANTARSRRAHHRDELPARRVCQLRGVQRQALQPRNTGNQI